MPSTASFTCRVCVWRPARRPDGSVKQLLRIPSGSETVIELNSQLGQCIPPSRLVRIHDRTDRGARPRQAPSHPRQSARCRKRSLVWPSTRRSSGAGKARSAGACRAPVTRSRLAAAYALGGETKPAAELAEARRLGIDDRFSRSQRLKRLGSFGVPTARILYESLRTAGMSEK
jgi:hypothetical protein